MEESNNTETKEGQKIKQTALQLICKAVGLNEPHDNASLTELIFRLQIFFPEMVIQQSYFEETYFFKFFYESKLQVVTLDDLGILVTSSNPAKSSEEARNEFTANMIDRKARLIENCIQNGIMLIGRSGFKMEKTDFILLPEFSTAGFYQNRNMGEDVFAMCIARKIFPD